MEMGREWDGNGMDMGWDDYLETWCLGEGKGWEGVFVDLFFFFSFLFCERFIHHTC